MRKLYYLWICITVVTVLSGCARQIGVLDGVLVTTGTLPAGSYLPTDTLVVQSNVQASPDVRVIQKGVVWDTQMLPAINWSSMYWGVTQDGQGAGTYSSKIFDMPRESTIYYRAYAQTPDGVVYGEQYSFTTTDYPQSR